MCACCQYPTRHASKGTQPKDKSLCCKVSGKRISGRPTWVYCQCHTVAMAALAQHVGKGSQSKEEDSLGCNHDKVRRFLGNEHAYTAGIRQ